jgi:hypothetical protein
LSSCSVVDPVTHRLVKAEIAAGNKGVGLLAPLCPISGRGRPVARPGRLVTDSQELAPEGARRWKAPRVRLTSQLFAKMAGRRL